MKKRREVQEFDLALQKFLAAKIAEGFSMEQARQMAEDLVRQAQREAPPTKRNT